MKSVFASVSAPAPPQPAAGEHEQDPLAGDHPHADRGGRLLVVADRLQRRPEPAAQQHEEHGQEERGHPEREPVGVRLAGARRVGVERDQRGAGAGAERGVERDEDGGHLGEDPHPDRELGAAEAQHEEGDTGIEIAPQKSVETIIAW